MSKITLHIPKEELTRMYVQVWNGVLGLTDKELEVTVAIVTQYQHLLSEGAPKKHISGLLFSTPTRKLLQSQLSLSPQSLNNYLKFLLEKGVIKERDGEYSLDERLIPENSLQFSFITT
jgi:hypothetical protein